MIIKANGLTWKIITEQRNDIKNGEVIKVQVTIAWCEEKGYTKEFYGDNPVIDLN